MFPSCPGEGCSCNTQQEVSHTFWCIWQPRWQKLHGWLARQPDPVGWLAALLQGLVCRFLHLGNNCVLSALLSFGVLRYEQTVPLFFFSLQISDSSRLFWGSVCQNYLKGYSDNYVLFVLQILYSIPFKCIYIVLFHFGTGLEWNVTYCPTADNLHFQR